MANLPRSVTTITPQRLSFAGGGTDLPEFYRQHGGAVVSSTIDKYIYVTVKRHSPLFNEAYRLSYSKTEHVDSLDSIENDVGRECLRLVHVDPPLFIATTSDLPVSTGLGSSSSFAVGLLYALHLMRGEDVSAGQLAEEACHVEINVLGHPIGKQDQYAAAFGGMNYISFQPDDRVHLDSVWMPGEGARGLFRNVMLFWTGVQRDARDVLREQRNNIDRTGSTLVQMRDMAATCRDLMLCNGDVPGRLGALLNEGWHAKRSLASTITTKEIDRLYDRAMAGGAIGGKIAGAGGGGFLFLVVPPRTAGAGTRGHGRSRRPSLLRASGRAPAFGRPRLRRRSVRKGTFLNIFLTGTESFIGRVLLDACRAQGIHATGIDSNAPESEFSKKADIRDPAIADLIPEGATVVHLAAISRDPDCRADPKGAFDVNVNGTLNVAIAARKRAAAQVIFASSEWVYGDVRNDEVQREDQAIDVTTMKSEYALSKIVAEQLLKLSGAGAATTILRFGIVYGPRPSNWSAVESLFNSVRTKDEITVGASGTARRFIHVDDIASGILASCGRSGFEVFNLSGDRPVTLGEIVQTSAKLLGRQVRVLESNPSQPSVRNPDNAKARAALGWTPKFDIEAGLADLRTFFDASSRKVIQQ